MRLKTHDLVMSEGEHRATDPDQLQTFIDALRALKGSQRYDVVARCPWDVQQELIDMGHECSTPIAEPKNL